MTTGPHATISLVTLIPRQTPVCLLLLMFANSWTNSSTPRKLYAKTGALVTQGCLTLTLTKTSALRNFHLSMSAHSKTNSSTLTNYNARTGALVTQGCLTLILTKTSALRNFHLSMSAHSKTNSSTMTMSFVKAGLHVNKTKILSPCLTSA